MLVAKAMLLGLLGSVSCMLLHATEEVYLTVEVTGLRSTQGILCCAIFDNPETFLSPQDEAVDAKCIASIAEHEPTYCTFDKPVKVGREYAVAVFHNEEGKKEIKKIFNVPVSGIGISNNPNYPLRALSFSTAKIVITGKSPNRPIPIRVKYLL